LKKPLDPQVQTVLQTLAEVAQTHLSKTLGPTGALSVAEKIAVNRQMMTQILARFSHPLESISRTQDFEIPRSGGKIAVRLYVPQAVDRLPNKAPVLIYYHGGGFVAGTLEDYDTLMRALANRGECMVISVAYRLAPESPYPAGNDDAWTALKWVEDHASEIAADPDRLAVGGDSAGGLLAAWVAQRAAKNGLKLRLQVLLYPNLDATTSRPSWRELGNGSYLISHVQVREWLDAYLANGINREDPLVSPLFATELSGIAPAQVITADHDPLRDEGNEYAAKLKAANIAVDHTCWPGMIHGFASMAGLLDAGKAAIDQVGIALKKAFELKGSKA
jgi:acetyl esterase